MKKVFFTLPYLLFLGIFVHSFAFGADKVQLQQKINQYQGELTKYEAEVKSWEDKLKTVVLAVRKRILSKIDDLKTKIHETEKQLKQAK